MARPWSRVQTEDGQAVLDAVGPAHRLVLVGEALHGDDRAEHLVLDDLVVLAQPGDHGRRVEVAAVADPASRRCAAAAWSGSRSTKPLTRASWLALFSGP